jgi:hypothetical protein
MIGVASRPFNVKINITQDTFVNHLLQFFASMVVTAMVKGSGSDHIEFNKRVIIVERHVSNLFTFEAKTVRDFGIVMGRT